MPRKACSINRPEFDQDNNGFFCKQGQTLDRGEACLCGAPFLHSQSPETSKGFCPALDGGRWSVTCADGARMDTCVFDDNRIFNFTGLMCSLTE